MQTILFGFIAGLVLSAFAGRASAEAPYALDATQQLPLGPLAPQNTPSTADGLVLDFVSHENGAMLG